MNRFGYVRLTPYLVLGGLLWFLVLRSGVHATVAGVLLAFAIRCEPRPRGRTIWSILPCTGWSTGCTAG
jgi:NhaA family Na+:H+ antiporter